METLKDLFSDGKDLIKRENKKIFSFKIPPPDVALIIKFFKLFILFWFFFNFFLNFYFSFVFSHFSINHNIFPHTHTQRKPQNSLLFNQILKYPKFSLLLIHKKLKDFPPINLFSKMRILQSRFCGYLRTFLL